MIKTIDTTTGAGDNLKTGGDKINSMMAELFGVSRRWPSVIIPVFVGDSKASLMATGQNSSWVYGTKFYPIHTFGRINKGRSGKSVDVTTGNIGDPAIIADMVLGFTGGGGAGNTFVWKGFTNMTTNTVEADMQVFRKVHQAARAAGAVMSIIIGLNPCTSGTTDKWPALNAALRQYCEQNNDCLWVDSTSFLIAAGTKYLPRTTPWAVMSDGIHESMYGAYLEGRALALALKNAGVPRRSLDIPTATEQGQRSALTANMYGASGNFATTGNTAGMQVTGGAGVTGAANWPGANATDNYCRLVGTMSGTMALAITVSPATYLNALYERTDLTCTRLTFSGTPTSDVGIRVNCARNIFSSMGAGFTFPEGSFFMEEFVYYANGLDGIKELGGPSGGYMQGGAGVNDNLPAVTELIQDRSITIPNVPGNTGFGQYEDSTSGGWTFASGRAAAGSVELYGMIDRVYYPNQISAA